MRTFYVEGTKKAANADLKDNCLVFGIEYKLGNTETVVLNRVPERAVIKFWRKLDGAGNPVASAYGTWDPEKRKIA